MRRLLALFLLTFACGPAVATARAASLPAGWPSGTLQLGLRGEEYQAGSLRRQVPQLGLRYHYLSGGVNTGRGWATWADGGGSFVSKWIQDNADQGVLPVLSLYDLRESAPGKDEGEESGDLRNLRTRATMQAYFKSLRLFFRKAGETGRTALLHVEPDLWGYMQRAGAPGSVRAEVASTGLSELSGLPNTGAGFAQAIVRLRDRYAPKVLLGWHLSTWGTGEDPLYSDPSDERIDQLASSSAAWYEALGAKFDVIVAEQSDRDAGYRRVRDGDGGASAWDRGDYARQARYLARLTALTGRRTVLWQLPLGNSKQDDTPKHYRDTRVEDLLSLGNEGRAIRQAYADAGVLALLFGKALPDATCACDDDGDGQDDDGGLFKRMANRYYDAGPQPLPGTTSAPSGAAPGGRTAAPRVRVRASALRGAVRRGGSQRIDVRVTAAEAARVVVAVQVYAPGASRPTYQAAYRGQSFRAGVPKRYRVRYAVPRGAPAGRWTVKVGIFDPDFQKLLVWRPGVAAFRVR